jgi:hypothetical protein
LAVNKSPVYGTPHRDIGKYPSHKLVFVEPADEDGKEKWWYAADRESQDDYNYVLGDGKREGVTRTYVIPREDYPTELLVPDGGAADILFPAYGFTGDSIKDLGSPLNSIYIAVERSYEPITRTSYPYDPALEKNITITRTIKPVDYVLGDDALVSQNGTLYEIQEGNAFHSVLITTAAGVTLGSGGGTYTTLPSVYGAIGSYPFPNRLDTFPITAVTAEAISSEPYDYDLAQDFMATPTVTEPKSGPYKTRQDRYITTSTSTVLALFAATTRLPAVRDDETVALFYAKADYGESVPASAAAWAREFRVPKSLHTGAVVATLSGGLYTIMISGMEGSTGFSGDLSGDYLIDVSTRQTTAGLYEVTATYLVLDGIYV